MNTISGAVVAGVDTHKDTHFAAVITTTGQHLGAAQFPATEAGYQALAAFVTSFGTVTCAGVEGTGSYGAGLARHLAVRGIETREVLRPKRQVRRMHGKSDEIDAYAAAETALAGTSAATPKSGDGLVEAIRVVTVARNSAVAASRTARLQIRDLLVTAPEPVRAQYHRLSSKTLVAALAASRPHPGEDSVAYLTRTSLRHLARRTLALHTEIDEHDQQLDNLVRTLNPALLQAQGIGVISAAQLLTTVGDNPDRIHSEAAFAMLCGACPIPASSGKTTRFRLNRGGDRQANSALHRIAVVRLHCDPRTRAYAQRRRSEGKTSKEILRCLKRSIAREVYHLLTTPPCVIDISELRPLRQAAGITLTRAASALGCTISSLSYLERGQRSNREALTAYRDYLTGQTHTG
jgi:transposase